LDTELILSLSERDVSAEQLETAGGLLREDLLALDVAAVHALPSGAAPPDTRGVDAMTVGAFLVSLPATPALLSAVIDVVRGWVARSGGRSVRVEIDGDSLELSQVSAEEQSRLIDDWLSRRAAGGGSGGGGNT
jgi:hypothetical protein